MDKLLKHGAPMNQNLRTSIGIFTLLLAATVSVSEVNAQGFNVQSNYAAHSGLQLWQSQPVYRTASWGYPSATLAARTYQPQFYNSYQLQAPAKSWSPQFTRSSSPSVVQTPNQIQAPTPTPIYRTVTNVQRPPVNAPAYAIRPAKVTGCQSGST